MQGYVVAFWVAAGLMIASTVLTLLLVNACPDRGETGTPDAARLSHSAV